MDESGDKLWIKMWISVKGSEVSVGLNLYIW